MAGLVINGVATGAEVGFKIDTTSRGVTPIFANVAEVEEVNISIDNGREEWTPFDTEGWVKGLVTAKAMTVAIKGKRSYGDSGNDYIAGCALKSGRDLKSTGKIVFPDGDELNVPCDVLCSAFGGGASTGIGALEAELKSDGKPTYTPAA